MEVKINNNNKLKQRFLNYYSFFFYYKKNVYFVSFVLLTWGFLSDIDIGSENMRWMGENRFVVVE